MDGQKFDRWARTIAAASSRRGLLKGLAAVAAGLVAARVEEAAARSCRNVSCAACQVCKNGACVANDGARCKCGVCNNGACVTNCSGCQRCDERTNTCRPSDNACPECQICQRDGGAYTCKPLNCKGDTRCCGHQCVPKLQCCSDADCPCGTCERRRCKVDPAKQGKRCGDAECQVCQGPQCVNQTNNATCFDSNGVCCNGVCCAEGKTCCGGVCCTPLFCVGDICCVGGSGFTAAGVDLCCPFGPPCGEGGAARCCQENQHCCGANGVCCDNGAECCGSTCCPSGQHCCNGQCQVEECACPSGRPRCPDGTCCDGGADYCTVEGCCDFITKQPCCVDADPNTLRCTGPCCPRDTEACMINDEETDAWCCPKGVDQYKDGCCPVDKPHFTAAGDAGGSDIYCCPDNFTDISQCTQTPTEGRRG